MRWVSWGRFGSDFGGAGSVVGRGGDGEGGMEGGPSVGGVVGDRRDSGDGDGEGDGGAGVVVG